MNARANFLAVKVLVLNVFASYCHSTLRHSAANFGLLAMSETGDYNRNSQQDSSPQHVSGETQPHPAPSSDIADAFHLFRDYMDYKFTDLRSELSSEQEKLSLKLKEEVGIKFKKEGNGIQHKFNEEISNGLNKIQKSVSHDAVANGLVTDLLIKIKARNKLIRIADSSAGGWATAKEYQSNAIADNSDDEKKIRQAEGRALKSFKDKSKPRPVPYSLNARPVTVPVATAPNPAYANSYSRNQPSQQPFRGGAGRRGPAPWDQCHGCRQFGHWRKFCPFERMQQTTSNNAQGSAGQRN